MIRSLDGRELIKAAGDRSAIIRIEWQPVADTIARQHNCFVAPQLACPPLRC